MCMSVTVSHRENWTKALESGIIKHIKCEKEREPAKNEAHKYRNKDQFSNLWGFVVVYNFELFMFMFATFAAERSYSIAKKKSALAS